MVTTREYRASVIIYKDDLDSLYDFQYGVVNSLITPTADVQLSNVLDWMSTAAEHIFNIGWAGNALSLLSYMASAREYLSELVKQTIIQQGTDGTYEIGKVSFYFDDHPTFDAIQLTMSFLEIVDDANRTVRLIVPTDADVECERVLVNGTWLEP